jgi:DNA repair photolyase
MGLACAYSCTYCYVETVYRKHNDLRAALEAAGTQHSAAVVRRDGAMAVLRSQLLDTKGNPRFIDDSQEGRVIYSSPAVDVAANLELALETVEACILILSLTRWHIRLLSKSSFLPLIAKKLLEYELAFGHVADIAAKKRMIFGVSTGTLDDALGQAIEPDCPLVSKRIESLHRLQDDGWRTFGMICPSLPHHDYAEFAREAARKLRVDRCEHVWAEVINVRGQNMKTTVDALKAAGFFWEASMLTDVSLSKVEWEKYARRTFEAEAQAIPPEKLRFLQYVNDSNREWWTARKHEGAVLL